MCATTIIDVDGFYAILARDEIDIQQPLKVETNYT